MTVFMSALLIAASYLFVGVGTIVVLSLVSTQFDEDAWRDPDMLLATLILWPIAWVVALVYSLYIFARWTHRKLAR
jgi:hypothetical protein